MLCENMVVLYHIRITFNSITISDFQISRVSPKYRVVVEAISGSILCRYKKKHLWLVEGAASDNYQDSILTHGIKCWPSAGLFLDEVPFEP